MDTCQLEVPSPMPSEAGVFVLCGQPAVETIRLRDQVTRLTSTIPVCEDHKRDHSRAAARPRVKSKR